MYDKYPRHQEAIKRIAVIFKWTSYGHHSIMNRFVKRAATVCNACRHPCNNYFKDVMISAKNGLNIVAVIHVHWDWPFSLHLIPNPDFHSLPRLLLLLRMRDISSILLLFSAFSVSSFPGLTATIVTAMGRLSCQQWLYDCRRFSTFRCRLWKLQFKVNSICYQLILGVRLRSHSRQRLIGMHHHR